ncbi:MAG: hypothetical protein ACYTKD_02680 [Planctomycetota bacterium]|jgi:hypothetical protein
MDGELTASTTAKRRSWPIHIVLAFCIVLIVSITVWMIAHETPLQSLSFELRAEGHVTLTAHRKWTLTTRTAFRLPDESIRFHDAVKGLAHKAVRGNDNLPRCPVRIVVHDEAPANRVHEAIDVVMCNYIWDVVLESDGLSAPLALPMNEGGHARAVPPPRDVLLANLYLPDGNMGWSLQTMRISQAVPVYSNTMSIVWNEMARPTRRKSGISERIGDHTVVRDLDNKGVGILDMPEWQTLIEAADAKNVVQLAACEDVDLAGVDGVYVLVNASARAADLVRALAFLTSHEGSKVYVVWPNRLDGDSWWYAPATVVD